MICNVPRARVRRTRDSCRTTGAGGKGDLLRTIGIGLIALAAVVGVLGAVFAIGWMRIRLADSAAPGAAPTASPAPASTRSVDASSPLASEDAQPAPQAAISIESIELPAEQATLSGGLKLDKDPPPPPKHTRGHHPPPAEPPVVQQAIVGFKDPSQIAEWTAKLSKAGPYEVDLVYAVGGGRDRSVTFSLTVGDQELRQDAATTRGGLADYQVVTSGDATLPAGEVKVRFRLTAPTRNVLLRLRGVRLIPAT
jgi:hypothetical protein